MIGLLQGKKILFFAPAFFNYELIIKSKMEQMGASVAFYDERAVKSALGRAFLKICPSVFTPKSDEYYKTIIKVNERINYDYVFVIKCDMIFERTLKELRRTFPKAKFCLYLYDSVKNIPGIKDKIMHFDYASSFDRNDCESGMGFNFRPLFFSDDFRKNEDDKKEYQYDVAFCGTIHSDRYDILKKVEGHCKNDGLRYSSFYYLQSKFIYYYYKLTKASFRGTKPQDFSFEKKPHKEIANIEDSTRIIIDIQHPAQSGLTMRTIEMIGLKKKIITTNQDIVNYDFYEPVNVCVIDRKNPKLDNQFLDVAYRELPDSIYKKYSLEQWILDVLGMGGSN